MLNSIIHLNFSKLGLSSYGGVFGVIISSLIYEKYTNKTGLFLKSATLSLPLIYSLSKLACFFSGCCYGIPYTGLFSITYTNGLNISLLPIQLIESLIFLIVFIICLLLKNNKYIIEFTIIFSATTKFFLDFGRYSHINYIISINQIISLLLIFITSIILFKKHKKHI